MTKKHWMFLRQKETMIFFYWTHWLNKPWFMVSFREPFIRNRLCKAWYLERTRDKRISKRKSCLAHARQFENWRCTASPELVVDEKLIEVITPNPNPSSKYSFSKLKYFWFLVISYSLSLKDLSSIVQAN